MFPWAMGGGLLAQSFLYGHGPGPQDLIEGDDVVGADHQR